MLQVSTQETHTHILNLLLERHQAEAAQIWQAVTLIINEIHMQHDRFLGELQEVEIVFSGPKAVCDILVHQDQPRTQEILAALRSVLPADIWIGRVATETQDDVVEEVESNVPTLTQKSPFHPIEFISEKTFSYNNQSMSANAPRIWENLRFRSESEIRIAQALDRAGVLFFPNCMARLGPAGERENREPDFLVCSEGVWGILEVDGEPFHPPSRAAQDHERDRLFRIHGVLVVEHFDANRCYLNPDYVVQTFLAILKRAKVILGNKG